MKKQHVDELTANKDVLLEKFNAALKDCNLEHMAIKEVKFAVPPQGMKLGCTWTNVGGSLKCI
jgi:hypothetical protein